MSNILNYDRQQIVALSELMRGNALMWFDVCKALKEGKTQEKIAELFDTDDRTVRWIKKKYCPDCGR